MLGKFVCTFFLLEGQGHFLGIRIKFHLGRTKGRGKREYGGEANNEGYFCKISIIKQDTNFISQTVCKFGQFFLVKNNFVYLSTSVCNDADDKDAVDDTDNADDADKYNRVIGIALLKAFSCVKNGVHRKKWI